MRTNPCETGLTDNLDGIVRRGCAEAVTWNADVSLGAHQGHYWMGTCCGTLRELSAAVLLQVHHF
jgi:hypothetical protein